MLTPGQSHASGGDDPASARLIGAAVLLAGGGLSLAAGGLLGRSRRRPPSRAPHRSGAAGEARGLYTAAGLLSLSVLLDSAVEHYRGGFENPGMYTPLLASGATLGAALAGHARARSGAAARTVFATAAAVGATGLAFHVFNISKRPGRFNWLNLFYAAPLGAPAALSLAGVLGLLAGAVGRGRERILGVRTGRLMCGLTGAGIAGTVGEAGLLHFRGAFQNPCMWLPVTIPPIAAALLGRAAAQEPRPPSRFTRAWLWLTAILGVGGVGLHAFGVSRAMGGWRNWRQNLVDGPPLPAPPAFSALAIAGLSALRLRAREAGQ